MSLVDDGFIDASIYVVEFKSKESNLKVNRTIVTPFCFSDEKEGINYIKYILKQTFQESIVIYSIEWMADAWVPKNN